MNISAQSGAARSSQGTLKWTSVQSRPEREELQGRRGHAGGRKHQDRMDRSGDRLAQDEVKTLGQADAG